MLQHILYIHVAILSNNYCMQGLSAIVRALYVVSCLGKMIILNHELMHNKISNAHIIHAHCITNGYLSN